MRVLALEPFYGGSHRAFLDGWVRHSRHEWQLLTLPAHHWKWRMRHAAVSMAEQCRDNAAQCDILWCSDMLGLAEFSGLCPAELAKCPKVLYFHENQFSYPNRVASERDHHFGFTNFTSALAADRVWFNSRFHQDDFLEHCRRFLTRMPDYQPLPALDRLASRCQVQSPGVRLTVGPCQPRRTPLKIVWAARWEHDKNPLAFFAALRQFKNRQSNFRLSVVGEQFPDAPTVFAEGRAEFAEHIDEWGYLPNREQYEKTLASSHVFVSTADHEFFGLAAVEAALAGCYPLLPQRLAYPDVFQLGQGSEREKFFYDGSPQHLARRLDELACRHESGDSLGDSPEARELRIALADYLWTQRAAEMDQALEDI